MDKKQNSEPTIVPYSHKASKKEQVEQMFDTIAPKYDLLNDLLSLGIENHWKKTLVRQVKPFKPQKILDIATGTGDLIFLMYHKLKPKRIVGIDLSAQMLEIAKKKAKKKLGEQAKNIEYYQQDAENANCKTGEFDLITCAFGVRNFEDLTKGLENMNRMLKDNGVLAILEFSKVKTPVFGKIYNFYFEKFLPYLGGLISKDFKAYKYLPRSVKSFPAGMDFVEIVESVGFKHYKIKSLTFGIATIYIFRKYNQPKNV